MNLHELVTKGSTRISAIPEDILILTKRFVARERDQSQKVTCRGRRVFRTSLVERRENGGIYVYCQFEDTHDFAWINPANLREEPIVGYVPSVL